MLRVTFLILTFVSFAYGGTKYLVPSNKIDNEREHYHEYLHENRGPAPVQNDAEKTAEFWNTQATATLENRLKKQINNNAAKNVILFLGDGMSLATVAAARIFLGQQNKAAGEETQLSFEKFPYVGLSKTYCVNAQVADSACSSTAYLSGVKANEATLGVTAAVQFNDCAAMNNVSNHVRSIAHLSQKSGKRTGIVTTTRVTHASPAGTYAHSANRDWESDTDVLNDKQDPNICADVTHQLVHGETGKNFNVILGGGTGSFIPKNETDGNGIYGLRSDNRNLIQEWIDSKGESSHQYVYNLTAFNDIPSDTEYVLGLFNHDHIDYNTERNASNVPSLEQLTIKAIDLLSQGDKGYFLFVEGGRIDHAHHYVKAHLALNETIEFHKAIQAAVDKTNETETLIVVTADHSHTMTLNGYPLRGSNILGIGGEGSDNLPYTTLSYANGPPSTSPRRPNVTNDDFSRPHYEYQSLIPLKKETHGGEDVGIYALGPSAHLFVGVNEQNVIPHIIKYASCVGLENEPCAGGSANNVVAIGVNVLGLLIVTKLLR